MAWTLAPGEAFKRTMRSQTLQMIAMGQRNPETIPQIADKVAVWLVPIVFVIAMLLFVVWNY